MPGQDQKVCSKCRTVYQPAGDYFQADRNRKDGLQPWCKKCIREANKTYRDANRERVNATNRAWAKANPHRVKDIQRRSDLKRRDRRRAYSKMRYAEKRDEMLAANYNWRHAHPERETTRRREWAARNPEKARVIVRRRRARLLAAAGDHTAQDIQLIQLAQTDKRGTLRCWWCGSKIATGYHVDHKIPLVRGGSNGPDNLCISCPTCNLSKHAKTPSEFNGRLL